MTDGVLLAFLIAGAAGAAAAAAAGFFLGRRAGVGAADRPADAIAGFPEVAALLDHAGRLCEAYAEAATLTERQLAALDERHRRLSDAVGRLAARAQQRPVPASAEVTWDRQSSDPETGLPDRTAFDANLARLAAATSAAPRGGLLVVSLDDLGRLRRRFGDAAVADLRRTVGRLLCRAGRDADLVCLLTADAFGVLLSDPEAADAADQAAAIRDAFRAHPFRTGTDGPEVLLTASFGFSPCLPGDDGRLLLDRAEVAVGRSRRRGRNGLHLFDAAAERFVAVPPGEAVSAQRAAGATA